MATSYEKYNQEYKDKGVSMTKESDGSVSVNLATATTSSLDLKDANFKVVISGELSDKVKTVSTGSANDEVNLAKADGVSFDLGNGSNTFKLTSSAGSNNVSVTMGSGSDKVEFGGTATAASVNLGAGADELVVKGGVVNSSIDGSAGGSKKIEIDGVLDPSYITLGSGNDSVTVKGVLDSSIYGGDGNNTYEIGDLNNSTVTSGSGRDVLTTTSVVANSYIDMGAGADSVNFATTSVTDSRVELGAGRDTLVIGSGTVAVKDTSISGGADNDSILINSGTVANVSIDGGAGNDSIVLDAAITDSSIYGGADNDVVSLNGATSSLVDLGDGNDTISFKGTAYSDLSVAGGAGKDIFDINGLTNGGVTITDYDINSDVIVGTGAVDYSGDGVLKVGANNVTLSATNGYYAAKVSVGSGNVKTYSWASDEAASNIDASTWGKAVNIDTSKNNIADTIIGSSKADTITIGQDDSVYGGAGRDEITISGGADTKEYVGLSTNGSKDSVTGFTTNTARSLNADEGDVVYLFENNITSLQLKDGATSDLVAKVGNGTLQLTGVTTTSDVEINVTDNSGTNYEIDYVVGTATVSADEDEFANTYYAGSSVAALNFGNYDSELVVDLSNRGIVGTNTGSAYYYGKFASVTGGKDSTVLMGGNDSKTTLVAGTGDTTLWGGSSKSDYLVGFGNNSDDSRDVFYFGNGDGKDSIVSSGWGNTDDADILWLGAGSAVTSVKNNGTNTTVTLGNAADKLTLVNHTDANEVIKFSADGATTKAAKVGVSGKSNNWTYEDSVDFYIGGKKNTLTVGSDVDTANIWLDGSVGKSYENVTTVDASKNTGAVTVVGGLAADSLVAGSGSSSLYGGAGAVNDTLTGGRGTTEFYFGKGDGNDVITASTSDDKVVLYNVGMDDVAGYDDKTTGTLKVNLKDGSSLTVQNVTGNSVSTFQMGDGSQWTYTAGSKTWSQK